MNWQRVKSASEIQLGGISVALEIIDKTIRGVTFRDKAGNTARVCKEDYSGFSILVPAEPEQKEVFKLIGKYRGKVDISETFDDKYSAEQRHRDLDYDDGLKIEGATEVVKDEAPQPQMADVPF